MIQEIAHLGILEDEAIELDIAALDIAALDHPGLDLTDYRDRLGKILLDLLGEAGGAIEAGPAARVLARVIGGSHGFLGDRETYDDPANADLIRVIDRRRGLPVTLSILYAGLGRRVGWAVHPLNTPGHVLVRVGDEEDGVLIDPFNGGAPVEERQLASLFANILGRAASPAPDHFAPMSNRAVLTRLLMNQATRAEQAGRSSRALEVYRRITTIAPAYPHGWWERARLELHGGDGSAARASLSAMLETTRDPGLRAHVNAALDALAHG